VSDVEFTARYATAVEDLASAWAFVMEHVDKVGPDPSIHITPYWGVGANEELLAVEDFQRRFQVVVDGLVPMEGD
jgi:hypothetical protein